MVWPLLLGAILKRLGLWLLRKYGVKIAVVVLAYIGLEAAAAYVEELIREGARAAPDAKTPEEEARRLRDAFRDVLRAEQLPQDEFETVHPVPGQPDQPVSDWNPLTAPLAKERARDALGHLEGDTDGARGRLEGAPRGGAVTQIVNCAAPCCDRPACGKPRAYWDIYGETDELLEEEEAAWDRFERKH